MGEVTVIEPDATEQVGCISVAEGADGVAGCAFITIEFDGTEMQPREFETVYV